MIHRWYVKRRGPAYDFKAEAARWHCEDTLEDTSSQVNPSDPLPHIILQLSNGRNLVFIEPFNLPMMNGIPDEGE